MTGKPSYLDEFWAMLKRLDLMPNEELEAEAERIAAKMDEGRKFEPLESNEDSEESDN